MLKIRGVDVVHIPEGPRGARMSALSLAVLIQQQAWIETVLEVLVPRPQPARHAVGPARRACDGRAQSRARDRRRASRRRLPGCDGGVRRRLDRTDQRRDAAQSRARHRRAGDRRSDGVSHRRAGEPGRGRPRRRDPPLRVQGGGRRRVRDHASRSSTCRRSSGSTSGSKAQGCRSSPGCGRSRACSTPSTWPTKCLACACRTLCWSACGARRMATARRRKAIAIARELGAELRSVIQGVRVAAPSGRIEDALAVLQGFGRVTFRTCLSTEGQNDIVARPPCVVPQQNQPEV